MTTTLRRLTRGYGPLVLGAALGVMCRAYEVDHPKIAGTKGGRGGDAQAGESGANDNGGRGPGGEGFGGARAGSDGESGDGGDGSGGTSGTGGANGGSGTNGKSGQGGGGTAGTRGGGASGESGGGTAGDGGGGTGGESGEGSGPTTPPQPGILGAVRLLVGGEARCGGSLITNDWVLTADRCVRSGDDPNSLVIGFGMDSSNFHQTQRVVEIQRFPGNDGTDENRGRDLLLLGVEHPFEVDGRTSGYYRPVWHQGMDYLLTPLHCAGWDLRVSTTSSTANLHEEVTAPFGFETGVMNGSRPAGNRIWWLNTSANPEQGVLPMPADVGIGCFLPWHENLPLATIHSGNPPITQDGHEAYSVALGEGLVHSWLRTVLFDSTSTSIHLTGNVGGCAMGSARLEVFGRGADGNMTHWTSDSATWTEQEPLPAPAGATLSEYRPGAYCTSTGGIELFATDTDGAIWWQRMNPDGQWSAVWQRVRVATTPVDSGIAVVGMLADHFYVFARGTTQTLLVAEYDAGWISWTDLGGSIKGTPSARITPGRIDVLVRASWSDELWHNWMFNGEWRGWWFNQEPVTADPGVVSWSHNHIEMLTRSQEGTLRDLWYHFGWSEIIDTDIELPLGSPMAIARQPGSTDLLITREDGTVWHGFWPRKPR